MEQLSRNKNSSIAVVKLPDQIILALQATAETGKVISLFEIEEITNRSEVPAIPVLPTFACLWKRYS